MNKKFISLLLAVCLVIGLLPVMSIAESEPATAKVAITKTSTDCIMEATEGGEAVYGKHVAFEGYKEAAGTTSLGTGYKFTMEGASATDWNFKFEYPQGGVPTLTLKNAKLINMDATGNVMFENGTSTGTWRAIQSRNIVHGLKIVLQGENIIQTDGIVRGYSAASNKFSSITIVGEAGGSLTGLGKTMGIQAKNGTPITIENADITLSSNSTSATASSVYTEDADITIKNSTLNFSNQKTSGAVSAIQAVGTGKINVTNSNLELSATGAAFNKAPVLSAGATIVAGDDAASAVAADAAALATAKYVKVTYPAPTPSTESTSAPTSAPTDNTSAPTTAPTVGMTAPAVTTTKPTAPATPATSGTVKLWGTEVTVDGTNPAYYWINGAEGALPVAATATDNWNYSFSIIDGVPTVTLKNANYTGTAAFLYAKYDGNLRVAYEGTNNIAVPYISGSTSAYFISYASTTNGAGNGHLFLAGAEDAVLNVTGGDNNAALLGVSNKAYMTIYGGTINMERGSGIGGSYGVIGASYAKTIIQDCTLNVKHNNAMGDRWAAVQLGYNTYGVTISNANVSIETNAHIGLCGGVFMSNMRDEVYYPATILIQGNSNVKVVNTTTTTKALNYSGTAISAKTLTIKGGNVEAEAYVKGVHLYAAADTIPDVTNYNGNYEMFTAKGGAAVTEYTATPYFKVAYTSTTAPSTTPSSAPTNASTSATSGATSGATSAPTSATAPAWTMTAPAVTTTMPTAPATPATSGTVTLWGTEVTVDETNTAYYWVNGAEGALPVAATANDNWNYSLTIVGGMPTVTLRNAAYSGDQTLISATYDGCLKVVYEGTNNIDAPYTNGSKSFINYSAVTNTAGKGKLFIEGVDNAVLNVTGGDKSAGLINVGKKADLTIYGGTINLEKRADGGSYGVITAYYAKTIIQDCTLNIDHTQAKGDKHPAFAAAAITFTNANVNVATNAHVAICAGVFQSNLTGVLYAAAVTIEGNSNIRASANCTTVKDQPYNGVGLYASKLTVKGGNLLVEGNNRAVYGTVDVDSYDGQFNMYTEKGGQAVGQYTATPYFMIAYTDAPAPTVPPTSAPTTAPTVAPTTAPTTLPTNSTNPQDYTLVIQGSNFRLPGYDTPIYLVNAEVDGYYRENVTVPVTDPTTGAEVTDPTTGAVVTETKTQLTTKKYNTLVKDGADESNYNAKLVWHTGDEGPTLYLKSAVMDDYNEDLRQWRRTSADKANANAAMHTDKDAPLKIVLESGESIMKGYAGLQYQNQLTIESVGDASLYLWGNNVGLVPSSVGSQYAGNGFIYGYDLILNANLTVSQQSWSNATHSGAVIRAMGGDIYIKGGKIVTEYNGAAKSCKGIKIEGSGNLYVEGGYIYSESYNAANHTEAAVEVAGNIYVSGGEVEAISGSQSGLRAANIYITGGVVKTRVNFTSLLVPAETGVISFTGGLLDIQGAKVAAYNDTTKSEKAKDLVLKEGGTLQGWVGPNPYTLQPYAGEFKTYNKLAYEPVEANVMPTPVPGGDIPLKTTVTLGGDGSKQITLELTKYDTDVFYTVNKAVESVDTEGNPYTRWIQTTEGADENNWNAKFIWHSTDSAPTLYLKGFKFDYWNEETSKYDAVPKAATPANNTAINTGSAVPMIIKLTGEDSFIEARFGIHYNNHLTILSEGDTKLTMINQSSNVSSVNAAGFTLTVDANLDLSIRSLYNSTYSGGALMNKGDIIINGGNIVTSNEVENSKDVNGIVARGTAGTDEAGDLIINGGNITVVGANGQGHRNGALQANGMLIINGGVINASAKKAVGMNGYLGVEINGGEINVIAPWYGVTSGYSYRDENGVLKHVLKPIDINGGTLTIMAERSFYGGTTVTIGEGVMAYAGAGKKNAEVYDGKDTKLISKPWFFATDDESKFIVIEEEEEDDDSILDIPTAPTTADGTGAPTDATGAPGVSDPTGATTPEGDAPGEEIPDDEIPEEEYWDSNIYVDYVEGDMDVIPDALIEIGLDSADLIWEALLEMMWNVDEYINRVSFFDAVPWFYDGEQWIFADEEHLPEDGYVTVVLPYPEGTDMDTEFTALHMFTTDTFGMTPGDVELLMPVNTEDGIELELTGLSPVMLGWVDYDAEDEINPPTGDSDVAIFFTMMLFSVLGMATVVLLNKKRTV